MINAALVLAAMALSAAYVCRVDRLSWRDHPWLMAVHVGGGLAAVGALTAAGAGEASPLHVGLLVAAGALLVVTYRRLPPPIEADWPPTRPD